MKKEIRREYIGFRPKKKYFKIFMSYIYTFVALILFLGSLFSVALFFIGYHSLDLGHNVLYVKTAYNITLVDKSLGNEISYGMEMYQQGAREMISAFFLVIGCILPLTKFTKYL